MRYYLSGRNLLQGTLSIGLDLSLFDSDNLGVYDLQQLGTTDLSLGEILGGEPVPLSGGYYYLDHLGRVVVTDVAKTIQILEVVEGSADKHWEFVDSIDLTAHLPLDSGNIIALNPDFVGNIWFLTRNGVIGYVSPAKEVYYHHFVGDIFENSLSISPDGVYVSTDKALYKMTIDPISSAPQ